MNVRGLVGVGLVSGFAVFGSMAACGNSGGSGGGETPAATTTGSGPTAVEAGPPCPASKAECVGERIARICPADGSGWLPLACNSWESCSAGRCVSSSVASDAGPDGGVVSCVPGKTDCPATRIARFCPADGTAPVLFACDTGTVCDPGTGSCVKDSGGGCSAADSSCVAGVPFVCKSDGKGFDTTPCAIGTHCEGMGQCKGDGAGGCVVGATWCDSQGALVRCVDGTNTETSVCDATKACSLDPASSKATCKTHLCTSGERKCGNALDAAADQTKAVSICSADGTAWSVTTCKDYLTCRAVSGVAQCSSTCRPADTQCQNGMVLTCSATGEWNLASPQGCAPGTTCIGTTGGAVCADQACVYGGALRTGYCADTTTYGACQAGKLGTLAACATGTCRMDYSTAYSGACVADCTDAETQCFTDATGNRGVVTCASGRWPTTIPSAAMCVPINDPSKGKACLTLSSTVGKRVAVCGDAACPSSPVCSAAGLVRSCVEGVITEAACPTGQVCISGACQMPICKTGETSCAGGTGYRTCDAGFWSATATTCPLITDGGVSTAQRCVDTTASGLRIAVCGGTSECVAGDRVCAADLTGVRVCGADKKWGAPTACTYGSCDAFSRVCVAQCKPGDVFCGGTSTYSAPSGQSFYARTGTCTAQGMLPSWTTTESAVCPAAQACRIDANGTALGCVECVGTKLSTSYVENRCSPDGQSVQFCGAQGTWATGSTQSCGSDSCISESGSPSLYTPSHCIDCTQEGRVIDDQSAHVGQVAPFPIATRCGRRGFWSASTTITSSSGMLMISCPSGACSMGFDLSATGYDLSPYTELVVSTLSYYAYYNFSLRLGLVGDPADAVATRKFWRNTTPFYYYTSTNYFYLSASHWVCDADGVSASSGLPTVCPPFDLSKVTRMELYSTSLPNYLAITHVELF
jgi:hypothetical protein